MLSVGVVQRAIPSPHVFAKTLEVTLRLLRLQTGVYKAVGGHFVVSFSIPIKCVCNFVRVACWSAFVSPDLEVYSCFSYFEELTIIKSLFYIYFDCRSLRNVQLTRKPRQTGQTHLWICKRS